MFDLLIRGGRVLDGTGNPWFLADVGVRGGRLAVLRGDTSRLTASRTVAAAGAVVCPGFVDLHAHAGLLALREPQRGPAVLQGVTTELIGLDGISYAPLPSTETVALLAELGAGLDGPPPSGLEWTSVAEYLHLLGKGAGCNEALLVGNAPLRLSALGWDDRAPSAQELGRMAELLRQAMQEGARGLSSGLTYPPSSYASWGELVELCRVVREQGGVYVTHLRAAPGTGVEDAVREAIAVGGASGVEVHISNLHVPRTAEARRVLTLVDNARARGVDLTFDVSPYPYTNGPLAAFLPSWVFRGGPREAMKRLHRREDRRSIAADPHLASQDFSRVLLSGFTRSRYRGLEGASLAAIAQALGRPVVETLCQLLSTERLGLSYVGVGSDSTALRQLLRHPAAMVASGGLVAGQRPGPRAYGTFPMVLGELCREEQLLGLPEAVRKMTSLPAQRLGLTDRGLVKDGYAADLVVFDPGRVRAPATLGAPSAPPEGIDYVLVNGELVVDGGRRTAALPGRVLRGACAESAEGSTPTPPQ